MSAGAFTLCRRDSPNVSPRMCIFFHPSNACLGSILERSVSKGFQSAARCDPDCTGGALVAVCCSLPLRCLSPLCVFCVWAPLVPRSSGWWRRSLLELCSSGQQAPSSLHARTHTAENSERLQNLHGMHRKTLASHERGDRTRTLTQVLLATL